MDADERGEIITGWLLKLVVFMAVLALVGYDFLSIAFTWFSLDDAAREVAVAAANATSDPTRLLDAQAVAATQAATQGVELVELGVDGEFIVIVIEKQANTLWLHRLSEDFVTPSLDARARWRG